MVEGSARLAAEIIVDSAGLRVRQFLVLEQVISHKDIRLKLFLLFLQAKIFCHHLHMLYSYCSLPTGSFRLHGFEEERSIEVQFIFGGVGGAHLGFGGETRGHYSLG